MSDLGPPPVRLLLLEARESDAELILAELRRAGLTVSATRVATEKAYLAALDTAPDIILADYRFPQYDAVTALRHLQRSGRDVPFLVVSGTVGEEEAVALIKEGAADYLLKDRLGRLGPAVRAALETRRLRDGQRRDEEALRESEERSRAILANALDAVIMIDDGGHIMAWSAQAERLFGWSESEVRGRRLSETIVPLAHRDAHEQGLARFRATGEGPALNRRLELSALRWDGTEFPVELTITPVRVKGATAFSAFLRDITERKEAQDKLRASEASFRLLFAGNPQPMWVYDVTTLFFLEVNVAAVTHYGYTREEFLRMRVTDIRPPEDLSRLEEVVSAFRSESVTGGHRHMGTWRHRLKDGRIREVDIVAHGISFAGRRAVLAVVHDMTELRAAERSLAKHAERLGILHEIDRGLISAEAPRAIAEEALRRLRPLLGARRASVAVFDRAAGEAEWLAVEASMPTDMRPGGRFPLALVGDLDALGRGEMRLVEDVAALPDTPWVKAAKAEGVRAYLVVPLLAGGELIGSLDFGAAQAGPFGEEEVSIARQVATQVAIALEQARLVDRVTRHAEELEGRVRERTLALEQEIGERRRAEQEAATANRAKSDFLSRMSHELRTPLNSILGFAQVLELDELLADQQESVEQILRAGRHLLGLINEVLDISRIESGHLQISPEPVPVSATIQQAIELVRPLAESRDIAVTVESPGDPRHVRADRQRLQQVLLNLLSNAVKYNVRGGRVAVSCEDAPDNRLRIRVIDTGPGIAPDKLERLFTPFDRLGAEATGVEGTGLGLTFSKHLVEAMGGALRVESHVGTGSTFAVELPVALAPGDVLGLRPAEAEVQVDPEGRAPILVLYIEDNLSNLRLVERIVARRAHAKILSAMQGRLGLSLAADHQPDLILLDQHLPDIQGDEVLRLLRGDPRTSSIPVVMLSADASPGRIQHFLDNGAAAYLTKPLDVRKLLDVLDEITPRRESGGTIV